MWGKEKGDIYIANQPLYIYMDQGSPDGGFYGADSKRN
jgi:hypothetical protein